MVALGIGLLVWSIGIVYGVWTDWTYMYKYILRIFGNELDEELNYSIYDLLLAGIIFMVALPLLVGLILNKLEPNIFNLEPNIFNIIMMIITIILIILRYTLPAIYNENDNLVEKED